MADMLDSPAVFSGASAFINGVGPYAMMLVGLFAGTAIVAWVMSLFGRGSASGGASSVGGGGASGSFGSVSMSDFKSTLKGERDSFRDREKAAIKAALDEGLQEAEKRRAEEEKTAAAEAEKERKDSYIRLGSAKVPRKRR